MWYDVPYYGKVDRKGFLVSPRKEKIQYSINDSVVTFGFVAQAFNEAMYFLTRASAAGRTQLGELLNGFTPRRAFIDPEETYLTYGSTILETFNSGMLYHGESIVSFDAYVCKCLKYLFSIKRSFFSYYSIFASFLTPINSTALSIDFDILNHDTDALKNRYFKNNELEKYINTMANFGFRINKNAPWQIIADLNSKPMLEGRNIKTTNPLTGEETITKTDGYMIQHYIPTIDQLFKSHYSRVMTRTFILLKNLLSYGYSEYAKKTKYVMTYGKPQFNYNKNFGIVSFADVSRPDAKKIFVQTYKNQQNQKNTNSMNALYGDLYSYGFGPTYFVKVLEKILKHEYNIKHDRKYMAFYKKFEHSLQNEHHFLTLELLEKFYSPTKIYDSESK